MQASKLTPWIILSCVTLVFLSLLGCGGSGNSALAGPPMPTPTPTPTPSPTPTPTPTPPPQLAFNTATLSGELNTQVAVSSFTMTNCSSLDWQFVARTPGIGPTGAAVWPSQQPGSGGLGVIAFGNSLPPSADPVFTVTASCHGVSSSPTATLTLTQQVPAPPAGVSLTCTGMGVVNSNPCTVQGAGFNVVFDIKKTSSESGTSFGANDATAAGQWNGTLFGTSDANCKTQPGFASMNWISATEIQAGGGGMGNPAGQASLWLKNPPDMNGQGGGVVCYPNVLTIQ